jgi:MFS family permease
MGKSFYEIKEAIPGLDKYYGILSGLPYSVALSLVGLLAGIAVDKTNRSAILSISCIGWSLSALLTGTSVSSLSGLAVARFSLGAT